MKKEEIIETDGSCPFSVTSSLNINVTSYDLNLDGIIIRHGSTLGLKAENLNTQFHTFLMNTGENDQPIIPICLVSLGVSTAHARYVYPPDRWRFGRQHQ